MRRGRRGVRRPRPSLARAGIRAPGANIRALLKQTFAQCGEDQIVYFVLGYLNVRKGDYLDVGGVGAYPQ